MAASQHVEPVFLRRKDLPLIDPTRFPSSEDNFSALDICLAAERVTGSETVLGAQYIKGLWRIYPLSRSARNQLLIEGLVLNGYSVSLHDKNPFILRGGNGDQEIPVTKLFISDIPISVANEDIQTALVRLGCILRSSLLMEKIRNKDGKLTRFITGRRFVFINCPTKPLDRFFKVGSFTGRLYHKEQPKVTRNPVCSNCLQPGHRHFQCQNLVTCRDCLQSGHKRGDPACGSFSELYPREEVLELESAGGDRQEPPTEAQLDDHLSPSSEDTEDVFQDSQSELVPDSQSPLCRESGDVADSVKNTDSVTQIKKAKRKTTNPLHQGGSFSDNTVTKRQRSENGDSPTAVNDRGKVSKLSPSRSSRARSETVARDEDDVG